MSNLHDPAAGAISFQVLAEIAFGATARVDLCRALKSNRPGVEGQLLAVKRLHPHIAEDPGFATQFFDEVWMTAALKHPSVVEVKGWGTDEQGAYLAVELVQGVPLARLMKTVFETGEVFSERMVVFIGSRLARGLAAAHGLRAPNGALLNLVHRDLTPANVLMGFNGDVKIADFGMAKAQQRLTKTLTGLRKGEPTYMAPEQARADEIDGRADLFSLGVVLFELFAGRRPWLAKSDFEMIQISSKEPPADLRELRPKIDKELVSVVNRCLEKDPATRFQAAAEIADRLENWLTVHGYQEGNEDALARFVRRNGMRQMRWFERAVAGEIQPKAKGARGASRVASYVDGTEHSSPKPDLKRAPIPAAGARAAPVQPPRPVAQPEDLTDVTDSAEWKIVAQRTASAPPVIVSKIEDEETEWGEEIPTLVKKDAAVADALRAARRSAPWPGAKGAQEPQAAPGDKASAQSTTDEVELRTATVKQPLVDSPLNRGTIPIAVMSPLSGLDPEGEMPTGPLPSSIGGRGARSTAGPKPGNAAAAPTPPPLPSPAAAAAPTNGAEPAATSGAEPAASQSPSSDAGEARDGAELPQVITDEILLAEADRLSIESLRRGEEARAAAARAERKATVAKMAADAASIAADAVRISRSAGLAAARQRLEEARQIERSMDRPSDASSLAQGAGPGDAGRGAAFGSDGTSTSTSMGKAGAFPSPGGAAGSTSMSANTSATAATGGLRSLPASSVKGATGQVVFPTDRLGSASSSSLKARPKPGVFGMSPLAIAGLGIVAFCIVFLILRLVFG
jgi:eukaryotic-like serine/threonine-protein kinase